MRVEIQSRSISEESCFKTTKIHVFTLFVVYESQTISFPSCDALTKFLKDKMITSTLNEEIHETMY